MDQSNKTTGQMQNWMIKQVGQGQLEYRPAAFEIPDLIELKKAHRLLLSRYVEILSIITNLSFFVSTHEYIPAKHRSLVRRVVYFALTKYSPLRLLVIKPMLSLLIESHVRTKLKELEKAYTQLPSAIPTYHPHEQRFQSWLDGAIKECQTLIITLSAWNSFINFVKAVLGFLLGSGFFTWLVNLLLFPVYEKVVSDQLVVFGKIIVYLIIAAIYSTIFIDAAFRAKREIFLAIDESYPANVYQLENVLFDLLNRGKPIELPLDYSFLTLALSILLAFLYGFNEVIKQQQQGNTNPNVIICNITPMFIGIVLVGLVSGVIVPLWQRWKSRMM